MNQPGRAGGGGLVAELLTVAGVVLLAAGCAGATTDTGARPGPATTAPAVTVPATAAGSTPVDAMFVRHMLPHHQRAIQLGALMAAKGADPRVRAFGQRIVAEQRPEAQRLTSWVGQLHLTRSTADAAMADGYIDDGSYARLEAESGTTFDRDALLVSARSEAGAAAMAAEELAGGQFPPARELARSISTAPTGEISELRKLAQQLR